MDSQPINSPEKPEIKTQGPRRVAGESQRNPEAAQDPAPSADTVSLSPAGRERLEDSRPSAPAAETPGKNNPASSGEAVDQSRKFTITEDNDVVVKILDKQTQEVVKQIPSEEELKLKEGIRTVVENLSENNSPDLNI